jgi:lipoprotein-releasing system ATP-binding protein
MNSAEASSATLPLLRVRDLSKSYVSGSQTLHVLRDLSFDVAEGEMAAITGVSGSGKSTLLHLLGGMDRPDRGSIAVDGSELGRLTRAELCEFRNRKIGFLFQFHHLLPEFSALENTFMPLLIRGEPPEAARATALRALEDVEMSERASHRPGELSGGEQQRVALARALVGRPRLLLADEPTGNLDPQTGARILALFARLHATSGLTSILVTHNHDLARNCSRVYRLAEGRLAETS